MEKIKDFTMVMKEVENKSEEITVYIEQQPSGVYIVWAEVCGWIKEQRITEWAKVILEKIIHTNVEKAIEQFNGLCNKYSDDKKKDWKTGKINDFDLVLKEFDDYSAKAQVMIKDEETHYSVFSLFCEKDKYVLPEDITEETFTSLDEAIKRYNQLCKGWSHIGENEK